MYYLISSSFLFFNLIITFVFPSFLDFVCFKKLILIIVFLIKFLLFGFILLVKFIVQSIWHLIELLNFFWTNLILLFISIILSFFLCWYSWILPITFLSYFLWFLFIIMQKVIIDSINYFTPLLNLLYFWLILLFASPWIVLFCCVIYRIPLTTFPIQTFYFYDHSEGFFFFKYNFLLFSNILTSFIYNLLPRLRFFVLVFITITLFLTLFNYIS